MSLRPCAKEIESHPEWFEPDSKPAVKTPLEEDLSQHIGGFQSEKGRQSYEMDVKKDAFFPVLSKQIGLFRKAAGLIFQNPGSGFQVEPSSARRQRYSREVDDTTFESPRHTP